MKHNMTDSLDDGEYWESWFKTFIERWEPGFKLYLQRDRKTQRTGIDGHLVLPIQIKADSKAHETGNVFVETVSVVEQNKPGWAVDTGVAAVFWILLPGRGTLLKVWATKLREYARVWSEKYETRDVPNFDKATGRLLYHTRGLLVPYEVFREIAEDIVGSADLLAAYRNRQRKNAA